MGSCSSSEAIHDGRGNAAAHRIGNAYRHPWAVATDTRDSVGKNSGVGAIENRAVHVGAILGIAR